MNVPSVININYVKFYLKYGVYIMYRSRSFNTNHFVTPDSLSRAKSLPNMRFKSINIRHSIVVKVVEPLEALNSAQKITIETMNDEWDSFISDKRKCGVQKFDQEQCRWGLRCNNARNIFQHILDNASDCINGQGTSSESTFFIVAYFDAIPIGILNLLVRRNNDELPEIVYLASHCGIRGCGPLLVEKAINTLLQLGMPGDIRLLPLKDAVPAYINMGFTTLYGEMVLYPSECSDKWKFNAKEDCYKYIFI
ncbi:hypothetical protein [Xenorhabdus bharatensis]|uniref:hypothetical protein n=1 Tax=Xenorhabdus bharatensis TaxID=3136256 RepID=UPI0030F49BB8